MSQLLAKYWRWIDESHLKDLIHMLTNRLILNSDLIPNAVPLYGESVVGGRRVLREFSECLSP